MLTNNLRTKKSLSQNWLVNASIKSRVIDSVINQVKQYPNNRLLEIGIGRGDLTEHLLNQGNGSLLALELDTESIGFVKKQEWFKKDLIEIIHTDALKLIADLELPDNNYTLYSSLPYNVGSRILVELGQNYPQTPFTVIVQKEVAQKTNLKKGKLTFFGVWLNLFWDIKTVFNISPGNFQPIPKVTSTLIQATPKTKLPNWLQTQEQRQIARKIVHNLMIDSKKTLSNNLINLGYTKTEIFDLLKVLKLDEKVRLTSDNHLQILEYIFSKNSENVR
jgi:16S rRNA (adenine1518-N6/adenine1519-N6)-dimethyltransferase